MSIEQIAEINCPDCDHKQSVVVWSSLNVQVSPAAKAEFFSGNINMFKCQSCDQEASLAVAFMYHDMGLRLCVQYYPIESMGDEEVLGFYKPNGESIANNFGDLKPTQALIDRTSYMTRPHIVFSMQEALNYVRFREKLAAFHSERQ